MSSPSTTSGPDSVSQTSLNVTYSFAILGCVVAIVQYVISTRWFCCAEKSITDKIGSCLKEKCTSESYNSPPLCGSQKLIDFVAGLHLFSQPVFIGLSIYYLVENVGEVLDAGGPAVEGRLDFFATTSPDPKATGAYIANSLSVLSIYLETGVLLIAPVYVCFCWPCVTGRDRKFTCRQFFEFLRAVDLEIALLLAPISHVNFFILGGTWYIVMVLRLGFYCLTFSAAVISGVRLVWTYCCHVCCEWSCKTDTTEIRDWGHLVTVIIGKLVPISLKLLTCSSAFATYFTLGILQPYPVRISYFAFSLLRGVTSMFSLGFNAIFLRWAVLKDESQEDPGCCSSLARWLDKYQPQIHLTFVFDMAAYGGLIALNTYILINHDN